MRLRTRIHEWFADRLPWVQYPDLRVVHRLTLAGRYRAMSGTQRAWFYFAVFWGLVIALSIFGNLLP